MAISLDSTQNMYYSVNLAAATGGAAMYEVKECLKSAGWTVVSSGTGTSGTYSSNSDLITSNTVFSARARSWIQLCSPNNKIWLTFQRINDTSWRIKIGVAVFGTGGNANTTPTTTAANDSCLIHGAGTDASPTGAQLFRSNNSYYLHVGAMANAGESSGMHHWWFFTTQKAVNTTWGRVDTFAFFDGIKVLNNLDTNPWGINFSWTDVTTYIAGHGSTSVSDRSNGAKGDYIVTMVEDLKTRDPLEIGQDWRSWTEAPPVYYSNFPLSSPSMPVNTYSGYTGVAPSCFSVGATGESEIYKIVPVVSQALIQQDYVVRYLCFKGLFENMAYPGGGERWPDLYVDGNNTYIAAGGPPGVGGGAESARYFLRWPTGVAPL